MKSLSFLTLIFFSLISISQENPLKKKEALEEAEKKKKKLRIYDPQAHEELSPSIFKVDVTIEDKKLRVTIEGVAQTKCFSKREIIVKKEDEKLILIPRFLRENFKEDCSKKEKVFTMKVFESPVEEIDFSQIRILSYQGWLRHTLKTPMKKLKI